MSQQLVRQIIINIHVLMLWRSLETSSTVQSMYNKLLNDLNINNEESDCDETSSDNEDCDCEDCADENH